MRSGPTKPSALPAEPQAAAIIVRVTFPAAPAKGKVPAEAGMETFSPQPQSASELQAHPFRTVGAAGDPGFLITYIIPWKYFYVSSHSREAITSYMPEIFFNKQKGMEEWERKTFTIVCKRAFFFFPVLSGPLINMMQQRHERSLEAWYFVCTRGLCLHRNLGDNYSVTKEKEHPPCLFSLQY